MLLTFPLLSFSAQVAYDTLAPIVARGDIPKCQKCNPPLADIASTGDALPADGNAAASSAKKPKRAAATKASSSFAAMTRDAVRDGVMKPDIVFFREPLPAAYSTALAKDLRDADLLIVMGSSLQVYPVAGILASLPPSLPAVLINREVVAREHEFDVALLGNCDDVVLELERRLGWRGSVVGVGKAGDGDHGGDGDALTAQCSVTVEYTPPNRYAFVRKEAGTCDSGEAACGGGGGAVVEAATGSSGDSVDAKVDVFQYDDATAEALDDLL